MFKFEKKKEERGAAPSKTTPAKKKGVEYDGVKEDALHRENVETAARAVREWEKNWSFLCNYDSKGELKEKEEVPENLSVFADSIPNTSGHQYGHRLRTETGQQLQKYEFNFYNNNRRFRSADLLLCD